MRHRLRIAGTDIPDFPDEVRFGGEPEGFGDIAGIDKIAPLRAVADNSERLAGELLAKKHAKHRAIGAGGAHPRAIGIEDADRVDRHPVDLVPVKSRLLAL